MSLLDLIAAGAARGSHTVLGLGLSRLFEMKAQIEGDTAALFCFDERPFILGEAGFDLAAGEFSMS